MLWAVAVLCGAVAGLNNGLARIPPLGFNTWDSFRCEYNEGDVTRTIDAITKLGLARFGYTYFNLDDCWASSRSATGVLQPDPAKASTRRVGKAFLLTRRGSSRAAWLIWPRTPIGTGCGLGSTQIGATKRARDGPERRASSGWTRARTPPGEWTT